MPTIFQRAGLQVNDWESAPRELLKPLWIAGYTRIELLLNARRTGLDPPPRRYVDGLKDDGWVRWGVVWADAFSDPLQCLQFCMDEQARLGLSGFILNAEDGIEARDQRGERWSEKFCAGYRNWTKRALCLNSYLGCGGIALPIWETAQARLILQTHHEGAVWEWNVEANVAFAKQYGWKRTASIKPQFGVYKGAGGLRAPTQEQATSAKRAGVIGYSAYYPEGCFDEPEHMVRLFDQCEAAGAVY